MPLYSDMYYNYLNTMPTSASSVHSSYGSSSLSSYSSSLPSYSPSSPSYSSSNYSSLPFSPILRTGGARFMPKLTTISETPLSKHRLAALSRISASHNISTPPSKYIPPRPRRMNTSDIDVSASRFENRRISESKSILDVPSAQEPAPLQKQESVDDVPMARSTIRRDRALVRLRTIRLAPDPKTDEPAKKSKIEASTDIDPGYGSSERSSGSWRKKFENEFDFHEKPLSPTSKSLGETFIEKYTIKETEVADNKKVYLTIDDVPSEQLDLIRRKSASKLPTFKEICSDISSDKLTDDLNAGDLRRRASLIIEEEINKMLNAESTVDADGQKLNDDNLGNECNKKSDNDGPPAEINDDAAVDSNNQSETDRQPKIRKVVKKRTQRTASKTLLSEISEKTDETVFEKNNNNNNNEPIEVCTFKLPMRKKKKVTDLKNSTCDSNVDMSTASHTQTTPTESVTMSYTMKTSENERKIAEIHATVEPQKQQQPESLINIKSKQQHSSDPDIKLLIASENANDAHRARPSNEQEVKKHQKSSVKLKTSLKSDVQVSGKMFPLKREPSADDFWGMIGSRETTVFAKRKQKVFEEQQQKMMEIGWSEVCEDDEAADCVNNLILGHENSQSSTALQKDLSDTMKKSVGDKKKSAIVNENELKGKLENVKKINDDKKTEPLEKSETLKVKHVQPQKKLEAEKKVLGNVGKSVAMKPIEKLVQVKAANVKIEKYTAKQKDEEQKKIKVSETIEVKNENEKLSSETQNLADALKSDILVERSDDKKDVSAKKIDSQDAKFNNILKTKCSEEIDKKSASIENKLTKKQLEPKETMVIDVKINKKLTESIGNKSIDSQPKSEIMSKNKEIDETLKKTEPVQPFKDKFIKTDTEKSLELQKTEDKSQTAAKDAKKSPPKAKKSDDLAGQENKSDIGKKITLSKGAELKKNETSKEVEDELEINKKVDDKPATIKKIDEKLDQKKKIEDKLEVGKKSDDKQTQKIEEKPMNAKVATELSEELQKLEIKINKKQIEPKKVTNTKESSPKTDDKLHKKEVVAQLSSQDPSKVDEKSSNNQKLTKILPLKAVDSQDTPKSDVKSETKPSELTKSTTDSKDQPKPAVLKKLVNKSATDKKLDNKIQAVRDSKSVPKDDKPAVTDDKLTNDQKPIPSETVQPSLVTKKQSTKKQVSNDQKSSPATNNDGIDCRSNNQKINKKQSDEKLDKVLNENSNAIDSNKKISPTSLSSKKKSLGTLSKFPTLNNLNSIAMNDAKGDNETTNNNNQSIVCEQLNESDSKKISIELEPSQVTASEQSKQENIISGAVESQASETEEEEEESSYEEDSSEEEEMGKKDFDPQKKVRLDFSQMQKFFKSDEKSNIKLVARPRPLWKIKRNRHAKFSSSESESDDEEVEEILGGGDSATGGSQSSTNSEKKAVNQVRKNKNVSGGSEISTEHIVALMSSLNLNEDNDENDNAGDEQTKKKQSRFSTSSHDSGYSSIGATAAKSPRKALDCDVNCHKKCEKLAANLCGVNQKLIVEALATVRRENQERLEADASRNSRESLTPPSLKPTYQIDVNHDDHEDSETSYTYTQFQKTGKITAPATVIPRFRKYSVEDFHFLTVLGKGSFGKVFLAELKNTSYYYAIKCLKKDVVLEDDDVECTLIERKVLALGTRHPYLCHLFCTFQTDSHLFFVMEYLTGGDLMFHIQQSGRFTEKRARFYAAEIVSGLKFLHRKGIIYRDLKLDNVLLDHDGHVRLADFGMCKLEIYLDKTADSFCGTPDYMPPEIIKGLHYNQSVDYWSFGVLLYEMLIGQSPFSGCDEDELFWSICNEIPWYPHYLSKESLKILQSLLEKDVSIRLGSMGAPDGDIKYHPFFAEISWEKLERRELEPPFKPQVRHPLDTQYFDSQFTRERARLTPIDKNILISMDQKQFEGFSYTNPNATLTKLNEKKKKKEPKKPKFYFCPCCGEMKITETLY